MKRTLSIVLGLVLAILAGVTLATGIMASDRALFGAHLNWFAPYFRVAVVVLGGLLLSTSMLVLGLALGHWSPPKRAVYGHGEDVLG